jgi:RNA polymerase sigma factor (sigma-70 family)
MTENGFESARKAAVTGEPQSVDNFSANENLFKEWISKVIDNDESALLCLYDHLSAPVNALALHITKQRELAEEVVQDTFWQVWRQAARYNSERGTVRAWVLTIARSRALDMLRQTKVNENELAMERPDFEKLADRGEVAALDLLIALQESQLLHVALASLEPLPRQLISLSFFRGFSHEEIAGHCALPLGSVKSHIRRALQNLQQLLKTGG